MARFLGKRISTARVMYGVRHRVATWPRSVKKSILVTLDFAALICLAWLSLAIRFGSPFWPNLGQAFLIVALPVIAFPIFAQFGIYRSVLRYLPDRAIWTILKAATFVILIWVCLAFLTQATGMMGIPRSVPLVLWLVMSAYMIASRFGVKWLVWGRMTARHLPRQTLIYGAGEPAIQLAQALIAGGQRLVVGLVSDDPALVGLKIFGLDVYRSADVERIVRDVGVHEVIITAASPDTRERRELVTRLRGLPARIRVLPPMADIAGGHYLVSSVRDIDIDDLLGRSEVLPEPGLLRQAVAGRTVLVTGAAGSIGSSVSRIIAQLRPAKLILLDFNEHGLYQIDREFRGIAEVDVVPVLGSITNKKLIENLFRHSAIDTVFHCAAYKHVGMVEENLLEGVLNNVSGTFTLAQAAFEQRVKRFVLISSDKAVRPASAMGATKRWSEMFMHYFSLRAGEAGQDSTFSTVRFGNVLGSSGSVVPLFKEQISKGGPLTLTHNDMTRYFMSMREAAELIVQASALSESGDILLLEMGKPVRIRQLAEDMIALAGMDPRSDDNPAGEIEIVVIGPRQGEKIAEELFYDEAAVCATSHPKILRASQKTTRAGEVTEKFGKLMAALDARDTEEVRRLLFEFSAV